MNVKNTVPLCLLAGMVALTSGCATMNLSSEDPTTRMEAVRKFKEPDDLAAIVCMTYPDDVRLEAFNELVANKDQASIDAVAGALYCGHYESIRATDFLLRSQYDQSPDSRASFEGTEKELRTAIAKNISKDALSYFFKASNDEVLKELVKESPHVLAALKLRAENKNNDVVARVAPLLSGETLKAAAKDQAIVQALSPETLFAWYEETKEEALFSRLLSCPDGFLSFSRSEEHYDKILKQYPERFLEVCAAAVIVDSYHCKVRTEKQKELAKTLAKEYPESELALDCFFTQVGFEESLFDEEDRSRVLIEANAQKFFERLQKRAENPRDARRETWLLATIDLLNACPEFAQKVDPKAAASLLCVEHVCEAGRYSTLPPRIAQAFIEETGGMSHVKEYDHSIKSPCEMSDAILRRLSVPDAYAMLKKKVDSGKIKPSVFRQEMQKVISACELNDATVETLLKADITPSAMGYRRLQAALKVDTVSEASKAKIQAYMEKARAEALANEAKAKEERLVIDHCYVPMREIDHWALPPQKSLQYGEKDGTITRFVWTVKQCYDWFELENDEFQWRFAQKFGLADFKFDMDVRVEEAQTSFSPGLAMLEIMGGDGTPVMPEPPKISVNHWWLSTTRARGKNVEFLYNDEDKNNTLIMREIQ